MRTNISTGHVTGKIELGKIFKILTGAGFDAQVTMTAVNPGFNHSD